eukprot:3718352-Lingulodinium_polyedra.AAC.1
MDLAPRSAGSRGATSGMSAQMPSANCEHLTSRGYSPPGLTTPSLVGPLQTAVPQSANATF